MQDSGKHLPVHNMTLILSPHSSPGELEKSRRRMCLSGELANKVVEDAGSQSDDFPSSASG